MRLIDAQHLPAGPVRRRRQPRQLPRRRRAEGRPARALLVRHQEGSVARAARRPAAAAHRLGVRRSLQSPRRRHGRASSDQGRRRRPGAGVLSRRHVSRAAGTRQISHRCIRDRCARGVADRARSRFAARAASCRAADSCRDPGASTSTCCRRSGRCLASTPTWRSTQPATRRAPAFWPRWTSRTCRKRTASPHCRRGGLVGTSPLRRCARARPLRPDIRMRAGIELPRPAATIAWSGSLTPCRIAP